MIDWEKHIKRPRHLQYLKGKQAKGPDGRLGIVTDVWHDPGHGDVVDLTYADGTKTQPLVPTIEILD